MTRFLGLLLPLAAINPALSDSEFFDGRPWNISSGNLSVLTAGELCPEHDEGRGIYSTSAWAALGG